MQSQDYALPNSGAKLCARSNRRSFAKQRWRHRSRAEVRPCVIVGNAARAIMIDLLPGRCATAAGLLMPAMVSRYGCQLLFSPRTFPVDGLTKCIRVQARHDTLI